LKPVVFAAALIPFAHLLWRGYNGDLTADPLVEITNETGIWILRFVVITLAITPIRRLTGWNAIRHRADQLGFQLSDDTVKEITEEIKRLSDERALTLEEVDRLLDEAQRFVHG
jgi:hypothetical protein